jgi:hypothetical protein
MRRPVAAVLVIAAALAVGAPAAPTVTASAPPRLLVTGREYSLTLSRASIAPGRAIVQFVNSGEDLHDLVVRRIGGDRAFRSGVTRPGQVGQFNVPVKAGSRYVLFCSLANHRALGMQAHLRASD